VRTFIRGFYYTGTITLFVLATLAGFSQTQAFKAWLLDRVHAAADESLHGRFRADRLTGNLVTGLQFEGLRLEESGVPVLTAERLDVRHDLLGLVLRRASIRSAVFVRPDVFIYRSLEGSWNLERLAAPAEPDSTPTEWTIDLGRVVLEQARVRVVDSLVLAERSRSKVLRPDSAVDYADIQLTGVNLTAGAEISSEIVAARLERFEGLLEHPRIRIHDVALTARLTRNVASVEGLRIETDRSRLSGAISLGKDIRTLTSTAELEQAPVRIDLRANPVSLRELRQFLYPHIEFLDNDVSLGLAARGTFGQLLIDRMTLQARRTFLQLRGSIINLHRPELLTLEIEGGESVANNDDLHALLPGLTIPDWSRFGDVRFFASFNGRPASGFEAQVYAVSERGVIDVKSSMTVGSLFTYKGSVAVQKFDLGGFVGDGTEVSDLNGRITFDGSDTDLRRIIGVLRAEVDSSTVFGLPTGHTVAVVNMADGSVGMNLAIASSIGRLRSSARLDLTQARPLSYQARVEIEGLNTGRVLGHRAYESDLNLSLAAGGWMRADGPRMDSLRIDIEPSMFATQPVGRSEVVAFRRVDEAGHQVIDIESEPASVMVEGRYTPATLVNTLEHVGAAIGHYVGSTFGSLDSLRAFGPGTRRAPLSLERDHLRDTVDLRIALNIRDLVPVGRWVRTDLRGDVMGLIEAVGPACDPHIRVDLLGGHVAYADSVVDLVATDADLMAEVGRTGDAAVLDSLRLSVAIASSSLEINGRRFDRPHLSATFDGLAGTVTAGGVMDSTLTFDLQGRTAHRKHLWNVDLDTVSFGVDGYRLANVEPASIAVGRDGFLFRSMHLATDAQDLIIAGTFSPAGVSDMSATFANFLAGDLRQLLRRTSYAGLVNDIGGIVSGTALFRGTLDHPNLRLELGAEGVRLQETVFGRLDVRMSYFEESLDLFVRLQSRADVLRSRPDLLVAGRIPFALSFKGPAREIPAEAPLDLVINSPGLDLRFLEPFLVDITRAMRGTLVCDLRLKGTVSEPLYEGSAAVRNARFLFVPTRFEYLLDGDLRPEGKQFRLHDVIIRNTPEDFADGRMKASGSLTLQGVSLRGFDLLFNGQLQVLREDSSRLMGQAFYGDLTAETGPQGLLWQGDLDRSSLRGTVLVRNAQITLPPEREAPRYSVRLIDVIRANDPEQATARLEIADEAPAMSPSAPRTVEPSFTDRIDFDLVIQTQGNTQVRFVFNRQTNDVLFADLRGRMGFQRDRSSMRLTGEVEVTNRSYYNFLKRFGATGKILFTGNPLDPELDITARYEGIHRVLAGPGSGGLEQTKSPTAGRDERVAVILYLKGPRSKLETRFDIEIEKPDGSKVLRSSTATPGDIEADAIAFIMSNQFRDELTEQERTTLLGQNLGYGLASGLITGPLSETLRRSTKGSIQSLDVVYYGGSQFGEGTDIRVAGQLGDAIYRIGGRVFGEGGIDRSNVIVELPLSAVLNSPTLRNLILTFERRADDTGNFGNLYRTSTGAKILYRFTF
jgi:hypothetical protein